MQHARNLFVMNFKCMPDFLQALCPVAVSVWQDLSARLSACQSWHRSTLAARTRLYGVNELSGARWAGQRVLTVLITWTGGPAVKEIQLPGAFHGRSGRGWALRLPPSIQCAPFNAQIPGKRPAPVRVIPSASVAGEKESPRRIMDTVINHTSIPHPPANTHTHTLTQTPTYIYSEYSPSKAALMSRMS